MVEWVGWGGWQKAYGGGLQDLLKEALTEPLGVEGEFYIGIPSGDCCQLEGFENIPFGQSRTYIHMCMSDAMWG